MKIKPKHLVFVQEYLKNGNNATQAYLSMNGTVGNGTARTEGSKLLTEPDIQRMMSEQFEGDAVLRVATKEYLLQQTHDIGNLALGSEKYDTALKAIELKGKLNRVFTDDGDDSEKYGKVINTLMVGTININTEDKPLKEKDNSTIDVTPISNEESTPSHLSDCDVCIEEGADDTA